MSILNWIHRNGNRTKSQRPNALSAGYFSAAGNGINPEWRSGWSPDDSGFYETRRHVGQSAEGFHAGVEICYRVYGGILWSEAHSTPEKARDASAEMETSRREEIAGCPQAGQPTAEDAMTMPGTAYQTGTGLRANDG